MSEVTSADCVIVGAGIGGAVLALILGQRGHRVIILERETSAISLGRPEILAGSTVAAFRRLGLDGRQLEQAVVPLRGLELQQARGPRLITITQQDFDRAGVAPHSTDPNRTRSLLLDHAQRAGSVRIERGVEMLELLREGSAVVGVRAKRQGEPLEFRARLVVGDDGSHSRVRAGLGIAIAMRQFPLSFLVPKQAPPDLLPPIGKVWFDPSAIANGLAGCVTMPWPAGERALAILLTHRTAERFKSLPAERFREAAARLAPECAALIAEAPYPDGFVEIQRPFGHAARYVTDGAALLGDAAHPVTPAGGQGANMSVADALALADIAHEALTRNDCSADRLRAYEALRRPANTRSLRFSRIGQQVFGVLTALPWLAPLLPWFLKRNDRPEPKQRLLRTVATAFASQHNSS